MRLAGKEKGGYYPTMPLGLAQIVRHIRYTKNTPVRLLDPCAGKAEALIAAANGAAINDLELLIVELSKFHVYDINYNLRNTGLEDHARTLNCAWEDVVLNQESVGLLWLNPPYDFEAIQVESDDPNKVTRLVTERVEYKFLKNATPKLQTDGLLVYIVPLSVIQRRQVLRWLTTHYQNFTVRSVPDPEYDHFDQVVVFATKKAESDQNSEMLEWLAAQVAKRPTPLSSTDDFAYEIPEAPTKLTFRKNQLTYGETAALVAQHGAQNGHIWQQWNAPKTQADFRPAGPPKSGHIATFITSGMFGVINLGDSVIRGVATKREIPLDDAGNIVPLANATQIRERYDTEIYRMSANGAYQVINKPDELEKLLRRHVELLHTMTLQRFNPLYNGDPTREEWEALDGLMPTKKLPGRQSAGLLLAQKHAVIAMKRVLEKYKSCFLVADMGTGKGPMGYSIAHSVNAFPLLVICPSHLVEKHAREAKDTLGNDIKVIIAKKPSDLFQAIDEYEPGQRLILIAAITTWSLGPGVHRVRTMKRIIVEERDKTTAKPTGKRIAIKMEICPRCGKPVAPDLSKSDKPIKCEHCREPLYEYGNSPGRHAKKAGVNLSFSQWADMQNELVLGGQKRVRTTIHRWPLATVLSRKVPHGFFKGLLADEMHKFKAKGTDRGYAFQRLANSVKYVINTTGTIFGGYASDLFYLLYRTMPEFRRQWGFNQSGQFVELYGKRVMTLGKDDDDKYGISTGKRRRVTNVKDLPGISPAIYPIILRQTLFMRIADLGYQLPGYTEELPTVLLEGKLHKQYSWLHYQLYEDIKAKLTSFNSDEIKDGYKLLSVWLTNTLYRLQSAFRSEMVMRVPPYYADPDSPPHIPYTVNASTSERYGYTTKDDKRRLHEIETGDVSLDETDLPEPEERGKPAEAVTFDKEQIHEEAMVLYPAVQIGEWLPKEKWLATEIPNHVRDGRKVLLYVEQTGTRNIQQRLKRILTNQGLRVLILPDGDASKREAWIEKRTDDIDVLITNPRKVETGLDLVQFNVLIFYELPTSLFTLQQAMKRVWRLGQTKDVLVLIPHHIGHEAIMENRIMRLMADKVKSAALLYGDNANTAFADEAASSDIAAELAKQIMEEAAGAAPEHFTDGIKSLLGDLVAEELAASAEAIEAALAAGEETAGVGTGVIELEEGEENLFDELDDLDDENADNADENDDENVTTAPQLDLFDFDLFAALEKTPIVAATANKPATQSNDNALVVTAQDTTATQSNANQPTAADLATILTSKRDAVIPSTTLVAQHKDWTPNMGDLVYIETPGNFRTPANLWIIEKIEGYDYWVKRAKTSGKFNRRKCNRYQLIPQSSDSPETTPATVTPAEQPMPKTPEPEMPKTPPTIAPNQTFTFNERTYRLRLPDRIGDDYDATPITAKEAIPGEYLNLPTHTWPSVIAFMAETGLQLVAEHDCTIEDLRFLHEEIAAGKMVLTATNIGMPTIHDMGKDLPEAKHCGYGLFKITTADLDLNFDAGDAMSKTPSGAISYSYIHVNKGSYPYPFEQALAALEWWINMPEPTQPELPETPKPALPDVIEIEAGEPDALDIITEPEASTPADKNASRSTASDLFFASWDMEATQPAPDISLLTIRPKKANGKKAARAVGANDAFRQMMNSEPTFK